MRCNSWCSSPHDNIMNPRNALVLVYAARTHMSLICKNKKSSWSVNLITTICVRVQFPALAYITWLGRLVETQFTGPHTQNFWFSLSGVLLKICISNKFPGDAAATGQGPYLKNQCVRTISAKYLYELIKAFFSSLANKLGKINYNHQSNQLQLISNFDSWYNNSYPHPVLYVVYDLSFKIHIP